MLSFLDHKIPCYFYYLKNIFLVLRVALTLRGSIPTETKTKLCQKWSMWRHKIRDMREVGKKTSKKVKWIIFDTIWSLSLRSTVSKGCCLCEALLTYNWPNPTYNYCPLLPTPASNKFHWWKDTVKQFWDTGIKQLLKH